MPYSAGVYSVPPGTTATTLTAIDSSDYNAFVDDIETAQNAARPVTAGGTGGTSVITGWDGLAKKGTDIATASSINLTTATGPSLSLTGTTTVTAVTLAEGSIRLVRAAGAFQITASASLLCNGSSSVNMSVAAEDLLVFRGGAGGVVSVARVGAATVASATTSAQGIVELATAAEALTGTDATRAVTPAGLYYPTGHLYGLKLSNGTDATNDIDIATGNCRDSTDAANMVLASALTKQLDAAWAVGTNAGGLDTGSIANTTYHVWLIKRSDTGVVDALFSTSASAPTMPSNYDYKRRIGSIVRTSAAIKAFTQNGDTFMWNTPLVDVNSATPGTSAVTQTLTLPVGIVVQAILAVFVAGAGGASNAVYISALTSADVAPVSTGSGVISSAASAAQLNGTSGIVVDTNTSAQVRSRSEQNARIAITTLGWKDSRGRV